METSANTSVKTYFDIESFCTLKVTTSWIIQVTRANRSIPKFLKTAKFQRKNLP